jgi:hypothetical protein
MERYTLADKSLDELLRDVESGRMAANRISAYADLPHVLAIKVAQANAASAAITARWARTAALASVASVVVAAAAVAVAILS